VGDRLAAVLEEGGQLAHVAADEFACVLVDMHGAHRPAQFAEKIRRSIEKPMLLQGQRIYVTCSVGVSSFPDTGSNPQDLLRQAEAAMLRAKQEGRNTVWVFANEQRQELEERKTLGLLLPEAIRLGQFELHYQPQIGSNDGQVMGFEALLRWHSPEYGLLPPVRFLGIAEELGLTIDIGSFVLESVCRQTRAWMDAGAEDFSIAVNVSSLQLQRPDFVDSVRAMLQRWNVPAQYLELELTENMMIDNVQRVIDTMRALKSLGLKLALDDFGTGYSSLNYLRHFPIDTLKIDQSFVRNISTDPGAAGICRAVISLGHQLGMTVLAEGVESAAQAGYLRRSGCDRFQGFYFARPMTAEQARELLDSRFIEHEGLAPQQETLTLLLLDDEENILNALKRSLRREGYRILTATDAEQAFDILARNNVEVILSDQRIPGASGTEFLSKVKELYPDTVRMMLSGYTNLDAVTDAINRGAIYKFLMKPWKDAELREQIHEAFRTYKSRLAARNAPGREIES
jgi:EAL domain-containing protein (putative c-di-GMP-specific phosphodiesterase class I)/ActR/RegA family two-component response regulator